MSNSIERLRDPSVIYMTREAAAEIADEIESLRHELANERAKIGVLLKVQINDRVEIERLKADLLDPAKVWVNMLRGTIARPQALEHYEECKAEIERLQKQKQIAVDALFSICQSDWGIGHSLAKPAHKAIKELAALEGEGNE